MKSELKSTISALAKAVCKIVELGDRINQDPVVEYHVREYTQSMEELLLEQLLTASDNLTEGEDILCGNGLDFMIEDLHVKAQEWNRDL